MWIMDSNSCRMLGVGKASYGVRKGRIDDGEQERTERVSRGDSSVWLCVETCGFELCVVVC